MKSAVLPLLAVAGLLSACTGEPADPWTAQASFAGAAQPGVSTLIATHATVGADCAIGEPPALEVVTQGTLGAITTGPATQAIVAPDQECDGQEAAATGVFYQAPAGATGVDTVVYRELRAPAAPDVIHTGSIRVR
jgi:hypothetical protein